MKLIQSYPAGLALYNEMGLRMYMFKRNDYSSRGFEKFGKGQNAAKKLENSILS